MLDPNYVSLATIQAWYNVGKIVTGAGAFTIAIYKAVRWLQDIREKDLKDIHSSVGRIESGMRDQTVAVVSELREMRNDLRSFYIPLAAQSKAPAKSVRRKAVTKSAPKANAKKKAAPKKKRA